MARGKLTVEDIQKALLTNTNFIKNETDPENTLLDRVLASNGVKASPHDIRIDPVVLKKFKILATYQKVDHGELINQALEHYLKLKSMQLEQAILKLTEE
jgi:hypothetical protein